MSQSFQPPTSARLHELTDAMVRQPIVLVADLVADRFITGIPKRISREAPVLILRHESETMTPGGGANAVANVAALGGVPLPLGVVGDDPSGHDLRRCFEERGIETAGLLQRPGYKTPTKTRILGGGRHAIKQQIVRYDIEDELQLTADERQELLAVLVEKAGGARVAVLSDYGYGLVEPAWVPLLRQALGNEAVLLGDSRYRLGEFAGLDGATPNAEEATTLLGQPFTDDPATLEPGGRGLRQRLGLGFLLVTRGSAGMSLFQASGVAHLPVYGTDQVADVTGAGDTVIGTFALALAAGASPLEAACLANYAGGIVVMKMGTATLSRDELRTAVERDPALLERLQWTPAPV